MCVGAVVLFCLLYYIKYFIYIYIFIYKNIVIIITNGVINYVDYIKSSFFSCMVRDLRTFTLHIYFIIKALVVLSSNRWHGKCIKYI